MCVAETSSNTGNPEDGQMTLALAIGVPLASVLLISVAIVVTVFVYKIKPCRNQEFTETYDEIEVSQMNKTGDRNLQEGQSEHLHAEGVPNLEPQDIRVENEYLHAGAVLRPESPNIRDSYLNQLRKSFDRLSLMAGKTYQGNP